MKTDVNGCSTCAVGEEHYEWFEVADLANTGSTDRVQYDYRHASGKLFSCIARTVEQARERRDKWLKENGLRRRS
jgi:hypothetical protein